MGTRNLVCAVIDGDYKIAQYGQWDGYPEGQGVTVLNFLNGIVGSEREERFLAKLRQCRWATDKELREIEKAAGIKEGEEWISTEQAEARKKIAPQLSRDTGGAVLALVDNSEGGLPLVNSIEFAGDSLFCEWAYVADFDRRVLEVYRGFNEEPTGDDTRFPSSKFGVEDRKKTEERIAREGPSEFVSVYHPIKMLAEFPFNGLPDAQAFVEALALSDK